MKYFTRSIRFFLIILCTVIVSYNDANMIAKVEYDFEGCFGSGKSTLEIYKRNDQVKARLENDGKIAKIVSVNSLQIDTFNMFMNDLRNLKERHGCTTTSHYIVFFNNEVIKKTDGGCSWNGFGKLAACLFGAE